MNICLLASWVKRYHLDDNKLWKQIIDHKYRVKNPYIFSCLLRLPRLGTSGELGMVEGLNSRKTNALELLVWLLNIGKCTVSNEQNCTIAELWGWHYPENYI
jgi:hypothetical protein